jgi:glyoxylase-like metal-dependent hydrolase (beta-lactamase superfamily II)
MPRLYICILTGVLIWSGFAVFAPQSHANPENIRIVAPGIWFREGDRDHGHCNNIIIEMKDYMVVVDANFPSGAAGVMRDLKYISPKPVKYVFDTHHHGDHTYGNALWTQAGATTVAFQGVADEMRRLEPARWLQAVKTRPDVADLHRDAPEPPKQIVTEDLFVVNDGDRRIEFRSFGWGHTRGDGYVYLPKEQVLCTGDAAVNGPYNYFGDANIANWPDVLAKVGKLRIKFVLPGHGLMGGREILAGQEQFLRDLYQTVRKSMEAGASLEEIQGGLKLPSAVAGWVSEASLKQQAADVYQEIKAGKPRGEL